MKWGLISKPSKESYAIAKKIYDMLGDVVAEEKIANHLGIKGFSFDEIEKKADMVVVVGGDGTILMTLERISKPIFSINTGAVGFLTEVEAKDAIEGMKKVLQGKYFIEKRMKLKVLLNEKRLSDATNEVIVHTVNIGKILSLQLEVNGTVAEEIDGDGIIIASPTGSTSYAFSVGGPVVDPSLKAFVVAPVAPFRHISSPLVIPSNKELRVKILGRKKAKIVIDGMHSFPLTSKDSLVITRSSNMASFIRLEDNFYKKVYERLSFKRRKFKNGKDKGN